MPYLDDQDIRDLAVAAHSDSEYAADASEFLDRYAEICKARQKLRERFVAISKKIREAQRSKPLRPLEGTDSPPDQTTPADPPVAVGQST